MRLLLDTHAVLWILEDSPELAAPARTAVEHADDVAVSAASAWEISLKVKLGKLQPPVADVLGAIAEQAYTLLPITPAHAWAGGALPPYHRDPFDRLLVAQAQLDGYTIVTRDPTIARYQVAVLGA